MKIMDYDIEELIKLVCKNDINQIKLQDGKVSVEISRNSNNVQPVVMTSPNSNQIAQNNSLSNTKINKEIQPGQKYHEIISPLVGTFYNSPSPEEEPFVKVGDMVKKGDTLCIVEAMKSMNEIKAEKPGKMVEICLSNAEVVEYNQVLFKMDI